MPVKKDPTMCPVQATKGIDITPGNYLGVIKKPKIVQREKKSKDDRGNEIVEPIFYFEAEVHTDGKEAILRLSYPASITPQSSLGRFVERMTGILPEPGADWDEKSVDGARVAYAVVKDGAYVAISKETVHPAD